MNAAVYPTALVNTPPRLSVHPNARLDQRIILHQGSEVALRAYAASVGDRLGFDLVPHLASSIASLRQGPDNTNVPVLSSAGSNGGTRQAESSGRAYLDFPTSSGSPPAGQPPLIRIRLTVPYRVHSRQMLCIGGGQIPFGWSFLSIAKVPMSWTPEDVWVAEVGFLHSLQALVMQP